MGRKPEGKAEKMFKNIGKKLDKIFEDLDEAKEHAQDEYGDRFEELKRTGEKLKSEARNFKDNHQEVFNDIEEAMDRAGKELKDIYDRAFKKDKES